MESTTTVDPAATRAKPAGTLPVQDVPPPLSAALPLWFMSPPPKVEPLFVHADAGAAANVITLAEHSGTHIDAPFHFDPDGATIDRVAVDALLLRPFKKYDLTARDFQPGDLIGADALEAAARTAGFTLEPGDVAVIETGWDRYLPGGADAREPTWWGSNQPGLSEDACALLVDAGVTAVASDTAACD